MARAAGDLAGQRILYPKAGRSERYRDVNDGHHELAFYLRNKRDVVGDDSWRELANEVALWKGDRIVISSEEFHPLEASQIARIPDFLPGCDLHTILYLRNPLAYIRSAFKQRIKMGTYSGCFGAYIREQVSRVDYGALLRRWEVGLGIGRVHMRVFDKVKIDPGLEEDFCELIGANFEPLRTYRDRPANVSLGDRDIANMRRINWLTWWAGDARRRRGWPARLRAQVRRNGIRGWLVRSALSIGIPDDLVSKSDVDWFRRAIFDRHEAFLGRYIAPEDRDLLRF